VPDINNSLWSELPSQTQEDLLAWYNRREEKLEVEDYARLAQLVANGSFHAWNCPKCGGRVYDGAPGDWRHFQGVCQVDYVSYPGDEEKYTLDYRLKLCDHCRCHGG
jgi:hypothetical protein